MTISWARCVVVTCAGCGREYEDPETELPAHYRSASEALHCLSVDARDLPSWAWSVALVIAGWDARCPECTTEPERWCVTRGGTCTVYCAVVSCDRCGHVYGDVPDGWSAHWPDIAAAYRGVSAAGWIISAERLLCAHCVRKLGCELLAHDWDDWRFVVRSTYVSQSRSCAACGTVQHDPPLPNRQAAA